MSERRASVEDALLLPDDQRVELIRGKLVQKASPNFGHALAQQRLARFLGVEYDGAARLGRRGGWWFATECDVRFGEELFRPDICAWRVDTLPSPPRDRVITMRPDWVCEVLSAGHAARDRGPKRETYWRAGVGHYWIADPTTRLIEVLRHGPSGYVVMQVEGAGDTLRGEPFVDVALDVSEVFGEDAGPITFHDSNR